MWCFVLYIEPEAMVTAIHAAINIFASCNRAKTPFSYIVYLRANRMVRVDAEDCIEIMLFEQIQGLILRGFLASSCSGRGLTWRRGG